MAKLAAERAEPRLNIRMDPKVLEALTAEARRLGIPVMELVRQMITNELDARGRLK